ncbi:hypothetical protein GCM10020001_041820 [Nonomuraea salmonea]
MQVLVEVLHGGAVATALAGDAVDHDRRAQLAGRAQRLLKGGDVVAVDRAEVAQAEALEDAEPGRGPQPVEVFGPPADRGGA